MNTVLTVLVIACCVSTAWMIGIAVAWVVHENRKRLRQDPPDPWMDAFYPLGVSSCGPGADHPRLSSETITSPSDSGRGEADLFTPANEGGLMNAAHMRKWHTGPYVCRLQAPRRWEVFPKIQPVIRPSGGVIQSPKEDMTMAKLPGAGTPSTAGLCVVCGQPYSLQGKGAEKPVPYTKNNKVGYAHTRCVKGDKPNAPRG